MKKIFLILLIHFSIFTFDLHSQWTLQPVPVNKAITGLEFVNSMKGWACTNGGNQHDTAYILNTTNGG
ncbi:MAG: hypothetical protein ABI840_10585, partial [bacterium]